MDNFIEALLDVLGDAAWDTLLLVPFLFATYLLMEAIEHKMSHAAQERIRHAGVAGPAIGSLLGVVPQCGFSAAAATLWSGRVITVGTLVAVFLSTSDEMLPLFIAEQMPLSTLFSVLGTKVVIGLVAGFALDGIVRLQHRDEEKLRIHELCERDGCKCEDDCEVCRENPELVYEHHDDLATQPDPEKRVHDHEHDAGWTRVVESALIHTVKVSVFVFLVSLALDGLIVAVGQDTLASFLGSNDLLAIIGSALVGLIPNCAASVAIAQLYIDGILSSGAMMSGLLCAAGVGMLVLMRTNRHVLQNIQIIGVLLIVGIVSGALIDALGIVF